MTKKVEITKDEITLLSNIDNLQNPFKVCNTEYILERFIDYGYKGVVWQGKNNRGNKVAIKFAIHEDYTDRSYLNEVYLCDQLSGDLEFARLYDAEIIKPLKNEEKTYVCFVSEWIENAQPLHVFIQKNNITTTFIKSYARDLCKAIYTLKVEKLQHDDLHTGNVLIYQEKRDFLNEKTNLKIKIIDMGSLKQLDTSRNPKKQYNDIENFALHLKELTNAMMFIGTKRKKLTISEKLFIERITNVIDKMLESNLEVKLSNPECIYRQIEEAFREAHSYEATQVNMNYPFSYISAEHIANDKMLIQLFADTCPWLSDVINPDPILLTGPRGCGKSTIFRRYSLKTLLQEDTFDNIHNIAIAGFYISCATDFQNRFGRIKSLEKIKENEQLIIHYFNLLLTFEIIDTIWQIIKINNEELNKLFSLDDSTYNKIFNFFIQKLKISDERRNKLQGIHPLKHLKEIIKLDMDICYEIFQLNQTMEYYTSSSYLADVTEFLYENINYCKDKVVTFLLDDYSIHRIEPQIQHILNPIIWDRRGTHIFKISSEKYGSEKVIDFREDSSNTADIAREFREVDCSFYYLKQTDSDALIFTTELLRNRLKAANYKGNPETLIGNSNYGNKLSVHLREEGSKVRYHGLETISEICSGDISALLEIFRKIFELGQVDSNTTSIISKATQHKAIQSVSRNYYNQIKEFHPFGQEMYDITLNFGTLCKKILHEGKLDKNKEPQSTSRIEVDEMNHNDEKWSNDTENLMKELVRRSIFLQMEPGTGRHSNSSTIRWQLRKLFSPVFNLSMRKTTSITIDHSKFKFFLTNPKNFCDSEFKNRWKVSASEQEQSLITFED